MDIRCFMEVLVKHLTGEQKKTILESFEHITIMIGQCPVCFEDIIPVDETDNQVDPESEAWSAYQIHHTPDCPLGLLGTVSHQEINRKGA